ncbi:transposase [Arthrobacter bambusae]|uniref:transposase n=1 Tax=Arthrobacter bambusae TaxID=1338426 RepID=UPI0035218F33
MRICKPPTIRCSRGADRPARHGPRTRRGHHTPRPDAPGPSRRRHRPREPDARYRGRQPRAGHDRAEIRRLVGVAPFPASSGKTTRHRRSRGGDRQANKAIHHVVLVRMMSDTRTKTIWPGAGRKARALRNSCAASNATSHANLRSAPPPQPALDAGELRVLRKAKASPCKPPPTTSPSGRRPYFGSNAGKPAMTPSINATKTGSTSIDS